MTKVVSDARLFHRVGKRQEMVNEASLAHLLRDRNSFVRNEWAYGEALAHFLLSRGLPAGERPHIVEVGGGLGDLAANAIPVFLEAGKDVKYTMVDLSPELQSAQRSKTAVFGGRMDYVLGDAEKMGRRAWGADFVVCNEVFADFRVIANVPLTRDEVKKGSPTERRAWGLAWDTIEKYGLSVPVEEDIKRHENFSFNLNYGVIKFLEALYGMLPKGGGAFVAEYMDIFSRPVPLIGHTEYSISIPHLEKVAASLGFSWETGKSNDYLMVPKDRRMVDVPQVNTWLALGEDPYKDVYFGDMIFFDTVSLMALPGAREKAARAYKMASTPKIDRALTPEEFERLNRENGWNVGKPRLMRPPVNGFDYYILRKT